MAFRYCIILFFLFAAFLSSAEQNPIGPRSSSLGGSSLIFNDVWCANNNSGALGFKKTFEVGAAYENRFLVKQLATSSFAATLPIKKGCFGVYYSGFGYTLYRENRFGVSYGLNLSEYFSLGIGLNYLQTQQGDVYGRGRALSADIGFVGKLTKKIQVAGHVYNVNGAKMLSYNNERVPSVIRFGVAYLPSEKINILVEAEKSSYKKILFRAGLEYIPVKEFFIRVGACSSPMSASFGLGVNLKGIKLDLSSTYHNILGFSPQAGLAYEF